MASFPLPPALELLARERNLAADSALVEALPDLAEPTRSAALSLLIRRGDTASLSAVVARRREYDPTLQSLITTHLRELHVGVRMAVTSPALETRENAIETILAGEDVKSAYLLADAVRSTCHRTRDLAAVALRELTARFLVRARSETRTDPTGSLRAQADCLADALGIAVQGWEIHFQPGILEAAMWMGDDVEPALLKKLQEPHTKIAHMIEDIFAAAAADPRLGGAALRALAVPALRGFAAGAVARGVGTTFLREVYSQSWLLADAEIERGCRWVRPVRDAQTWVYEISALPDDEAARAVRVFAAVGGSRELKLAVFWGLLETGRAALRREVLWRLVEDGSDGSTDLLTSIASRSGDELAEIAQRESRRRKWAPTVGQALTGSPVLASDAASSTDAFDRFFAEFDQVSARERAAALEGLRFASPDWLTLVRAKLQSVNPFERVRALRMAGSLGLLREFEAQIYQLAHDAESTVRGVAVSLLTQLPGPTTTRIVRAAVNDPDSRVQANAIEALDQLNVDDRAATLTSKLGSRHNRVRANAVQSLLRLELRQAGEALLEMLDDPARAHRLSALWVIERLRLRTLLHRILELSRSDPDERVRQRAQRVFRDLLADGGRSIDRVLPAETPMTLDKDAEWH